MGFMVVSSLFSFAMMVIDGEMNNIGTCGCDGAVILRRRTEVKGERGINNGMVRCEYYQRSSTMMM